MRVVQLSPWDEMGWFDLPKESQVSIDSLSWQLIVRQNPRRIGLIVGIARNSPVADVYITTDHNSSLTAGILTSTATGVLSFQQKDWGILCQSPLYARTAAATAIVTVIEVLLRDWPRVVTEE